MNTGSPSDEDASGPQPAVREHMSRVVWDDGEVRSTEGKATPSRQAGNDRRGKEPQLKEQRRKHPL
jgi:hypothetical protein